MKKNIPYVIIIRETEIKKRDDYMYKDPFKEYIRQSEPNKRDKGYAWHTAIGLQAVDGLKTSKYLIDTAIKNIEGDISIDEAQELLNSYYEENPKSGDDERTEEADKVAVRMLDGELRETQTTDYFSKHRRSDCAVRELTAR